MKYVEIPYFLFSALIHYHLIFEDNEKKQVKEFICNGLEAKLKSLVAQNLYNKYKLARSSEDREKAHKEYINFVKENDYYLN